MNLFILNVFFYKYLYQFISLSHPDVLLHGKEIIDISH